MESINSKTDVILSATSLRHLSSISKWAYFMSIAGISMMLLVVGFLLFIMITAPIPLGNTKITFGFNILMSGVYVVPLYFLFRFSRLCKQGVEGRVERQLQQALGFLHQHFLFVGVVAIIAIGVILLASLVFAVGVATGMLPWFSS